MTQESFNLFISTLIFILIQAIVSSIVISSIAVLLSPGMVSILQSFRDVVELSTICTLTSSFSICVLSSLVYGMINVCVFVGVDPDNIAPPVAAALGDLATVTVLVGIDHCYESFPKLLSLVAVVIVIIISTAGSLYLIRQCQPSSSPELDSLTIRWSTMLGSFVPLFGAILMSSVSGQFLAHFAHRLTNLARLQIAINGVGGCFGSILISRMITRLHACCKRPTSPVLVSRKLSGRDSPVPHVLTGHQSSCVEYPDHNDQQNDCLTLGVEEDAKVVFRLILFSCVPIHAILAFASYAMHNLTEAPSHLVLSNVSSDFSPTTVIAYLLAGFSQVYVVLCFARWIVIAYFNYLVKPISLSVPSEMGSASLASLDLTAVALTTGFGDFIGGIFLVLSLNFLQI